MQVLDHCTIYFLIAGTYTPVALVAIRAKYPAIGWIIFGIVWGLAALATTLTAIDLKKYNLTEKDVICHCEGYKKGIATNHGDVMHWFPKFGKNMETVRAEAKALKKQGADIVIVLAHSGIGKETAPEHMREALEKGCFPQETEAEIRKAFRALGAARVAVRSSATAEDLEDASFAGQQ